MPFAKLAALASSLASSPLVRAAGFFISQPHFFHCFVDILARVSWEKERGSVWNKPCPAQHLSNVCRWTTWRSISLIEFSILLLALHMTCHSWSAPCFPVFAKNAAAVSFKADISIGGHTLVFQYLAATRERLEIQFATFSWDDTDL